MSRRRGRGAAIAAAVLAATAPAPLRGAEGEPVAGVSPAVDSLLVAGSPLIMDARFDRGLALFEEAIRLAPDDPAGYAARAGAYWWLFARDPTVELYDEELLSSIAEAIERAEAAVAEEPGSARARMYLGGAYGLRARFKVLRSEWMGAAQDGKKAYAHLQKAVELDPELWDAYLGIGMYDYYTSVLPKVVKAVQVLMFIPRGDRERGLRALEAAREHGHLVGPEAQFFLADIYLEYEKQPHKALALVRDLRVRFPNNPYFHLLEGVIQVDHLAQYRTGIAELEELRESCRDGRYPFAEDVSARAGYYLGKAHLWRKQYDAAAGEFRLLLSEGPAQPPWLVPWSHFRLGQVFDLTGQRPQALEQYRAVLAGPDTGKLHQYARERLRDPFRLDNRS